MDKRIVALALGPTLFLLFNFWPASGSNPQLIMLGILLWMLTWWITNAVPIGVTSLLPMILFPLCGILDLKTTTASYANPIIYLFFGGFVLGLALEKWQLHKRIALNIMRGAGESPQRIILGSMLATAILSMWISNTATTVMMLPIGMSVVNLLQNKVENPKAAQNFGLTLMLGIAYAANLGGMATLIGTPPNLVLAGLVDEAGMSPLGFATWLFFALPLVIVLFAMVYWLNTKVIFPVRLPALNGFGVLIKSELTSLGKMGSAEKRVLIILCATALLWVFRAQLNQWPPLTNLSDTIIAIAAVLALFITPSGKQQATPLLEWPDMTKLPWGILLLFGGGISLAKGMEVTQMVNTVGTWISSVSYPSLLVLILVVCFFAVFLTEVMSNVALVSVFIPVSFVIASSLQVDSLALAIPLTLGASCAFMFPISTPPNAIVFSSGQIKMGQMAKAGVFLNLLSIAIISLYCYYLVPLFFG
jgi:sodium-dependent dicarboxylate transporter 2/3/5